MIKHLFDISAEFENLLEMCHNAEIGDETIQEKLQQLKKDALDQIDTELALVYGWAAVIEKADATDVESIAKAARISWIFTRGQLSELITYPGSWERE